jgi:carbamoyl-phosphate synthase large subunit
MNVLLTCAGRRSYAVDAFRQALNGRGQVFACDCSADAPALHLADQAFVVPHTEDKGYIEALLGLCKLHRVGLLIPALEPELPLLAAHHARFAAVGTTALVSSPAVIATCYDKLAAARFLAGCGVAAPRTFCSFDHALRAVSHGEVSFPLVVKPRWGVSSIGIGFAENDEELTRCVARARQQVRNSFLARASAADPECDILIQEQLLGNEYGLDVINDLKSRYVCTFARRKLRMRAGQTDRAMTVREESLETLGRRIAENLGHVGLLDCDVFLTPGGSSVIDLNPRIGGGYPFSHAAGANFPAALVAWVLGKEPDAAWLRVKSNVTVSRTDTFLVAGQHDAQSAIEAIGGREENSGRFAPIHS